MNMWTRSELKERGKAALHRNYWIVVLVTLVVTALTGGTGNAAGNGSLQEGNNINGQDRNHYLWKTGCDGYQNLCRNFIKNIVLIASYGQIHN